MLALWLTRLASANWRFICIDGGKALRTIWKDLETEFLETFNLCTAQSLWFAAQAQELARPLTRSGRKNENGRGLQGSDRGRENVAQKTGRHSY
jgi:hypothetical protein